MPTPRDTAAPDLAQLARDCEARAAAGEKPVLEWTQNNLGWTANKAPSQPHVFEMHNGRFDVFGEPNVNLTSVVAAQLFAESLLRAATAPLHPQAPEVAAAVLMARDVLNGVPVRRAAMDRGLMVRVSRNDIRFTALGRTLMQLATPDPAPTPTPKEANDADH